jgi:threonylcarbamoyladenosine tRNA methylthiotransferase MtaB
MPLRVAFFTLGCKLNQLETESFVDAFARAGSVVRAFDAEEGERLESGADLVVINTCTVTSKADQKARRMLRLALAANPRVVALLTGCYAEVASRDLASLDERALVLPGLGKEALLGLPAWLKARTEGRELLESLREWLALVGSAPQLSAGGGEGVRAASGGEGRFAFNPESFSFHSRPSLKVQDGCDNECSYCLVRIARGRSVSLAAREILSRAQALEAAGRAEIVLTGVNLSCYRDGPVDFPALLKLLLSGTRRIAFRLSSYEPNRIDEAFLEAFSDPRVRPHVHLAVQSGSAALLRGMGRRYSPSDILAAVAALRGARRDPFIAADFISGFPGESEAEAAASLELAGNCDFAWIHSFRFSPRPGTRAASLPGRVPERLTTARAEALFKLGKAGKAAYIDRWRGATTAAVLELGFCATTDNYLRLRMLGLPAEALAGQAILCKIEGDSISPGEGRAEGIARFLQFG